MNPAITLRKTIEADLETLFAHQADDEYAFMAAFMNERFKDKDFYVERWKRFLRDDTINSWTIILDNEIAGSVGTWVSDGETQVTYGVNKTLWGRGIASAALTEFLKLNPKRPLYGSVAFDNVGSAKVLRKCGFKQTGIEKGHAHARGKEIDEVVYVLDK